MIRIWTDGSCLVNPGGPGGWSFVASPNLFLNGDEVIRAGGSMNTNSNKMELLAIHQALDWAILDKHTHVTIYSDSKYALSACKNMYDWARQHWHGITHPDVAIVREIYGVAVKLKVEFEWVAGHSGNVFNELANCLAVGKATDFKGEQSVSFDEVEVGDKIAARLNNSFYTKIYKAYAKFPDSHTIVLVPLGKKASRTPFVIQERFFNSKKFIKIIW